nr:MarR family transcriptional regulator [Secundilactobacillus angelensis]
MAPFEVNSSNYFYVMKIGANPGISQHDFNQLVHLNPSSITRAVNQLIKKGLVRKSTSPVDKRVTQLFLTEEGSTINRGIERHINHLNASLLTELEPDQKRAYQTVIQLRQLIEHKPE